jgi:hypothetical protein
MAYKLALPSKLAKVHDIFHISLLRKAKVDPSRVLLQVPIEIKKDLALEVKPVKILNRSEKKFRSKKVHVIKVLWRSSQIEEETWERESEMRRKYPNLFLDPVLH